MSPRRLALRLVACLLAGAALTVAVGWAIALRSPAGPLVHPPPQSLALRWPLVVPRNWPELPERARKWSLRTRTYLVFSAPDRVVHQSDDPRISFSGTFQVDQFLSGIPFRALSMSFVNSPTGAGGKLGAIRAPGFITSPNRLDRVPIHPLWPGFALDTAFYGAILFVLWSAPVAIRRRTRRRRGHCPTCNYDLQGTTAGPCPECGTPAT
jgi:hypothetical protein